MTFDERRLNALYDIHDKMEAALRCVNHQSATKVYKLLWAAHDTLERVVIAEQARMGKV
jgi:hypothetical protein